MQLSEANRKRKKNIQTAKRLLPVEIPKRDGWWDDLVIPEVPYIPMENNIDPEIALNVNNPRLYKRFNRIRNKTENLHSTAEFAKLNVSLIKEGRPRGMLGTMLDTIAPKTERGLMAAYNRYYECLMEYIDFCEKNDIPLKNVPQKQTISESQEGIRLVRSSS